MLNGGKQKVFGYDSGGCGHKTWADDRTLEIRKKLDIREGTRLTVEADSGKVVFRKAPSIFDLAGKSRLTKDEAFRLLDKMREES